MLLKTSYKFPIGTHFKVVKCPHSSHAILVSSEMHIFIQSLPWLQGICWDLPSVCPKFINYLYTHLDHELLCYTNPFDTVPSPLPLPNLSSCFPVYCSAHWHFCLSPYSHMTFWEQEVTMSAELFTPCCVSVWYWRSISSIHKEKPVCFSSSLWVSDAEDSQIPVVFAMWLLSFRQEKPCLTSQLFS